MYLGKSFLISNDDGGRLLIEVMCFFLNLVIFLLILGWRFLNLFLRYLLSDISIFDCLVCFCDF